MNTENAGLGGPSGQLTGQRLLLTAGHRLLLTAGHRLLLAGWTVFAVSTVIRPQPGHIALFDSWLYDGLTLLGAGLVAVAGRSAPGRRGWLLLAAAMTLAAAGDVIYAAIGFPESSPSAADPLYLAFYPLAYAGLVVLLASRRRRVPAAVWLDGLTVGLALAAVCAAAAFGPISAATGGSPAAVIVGLAYPVGDLLLLAVVGAALAVLGWRAERSWLLLAAGLSLYAVADTLYLFQTAAGRYLEGSWMDALWPAGVLLLARAACRAEPAAGTSATPPTRALLLPPLLCTTAAAAVLVADHDLRLPRLAVVLAAAVLVTVAARLALTVREVAALADSRVEARTDPLTGLANRRALLEQLASLLQPEPATVGRLALIILDLDRFKEVNDSLGHAAGDQLLVQVASRLQQALPADGLLARLGGDEFAVVLPGADLDQAEQAADQLLAALQNPFPLDRMALHATASLGVATCPQHAADVTALLQRTDLALYQAKTTRGGVAVYDPSARDPFQDRLQTLEELHAALAGDQLMLHYQPKASLPDGRITGVEALIRWRHPQTGLRYPDSFLPLVEEAGLMSSLTDRVLHLALDQILAWQAEGLPPLTVAVNLSASSTVDAALPGRVAAALAARSLPGPVLVLEITEQFLMADRVRARGVLTDLRRLGVTISIDDFGTGYSSLAYLRDLPVDELKLDRAFVAPLADDPHAASLVRSTTALTHALGLRMVAEGVENQATADELVRYGCDQLQGYHLARPLPGAALAHWLRQRTLHAAGPAATPSTPGSRQPIRPATRPRAG